MKAVKIVFVSLISVLSIIIIAGISAAYFYGGSIKKIALNELNKDLKTKVHISNIDISFLQNLPYASLILDEVYIESVNDFNKSSFKNINHDTLLFAESLSLSFNLFKALKSEFILNKVIIRKGKLNILIDKSGNDNYHLWDSNNKTDNSQLNIDLKDIVFNNVDFQLIDRSSQTKVISYIENMKLSGKLNSSNISSSADINLKISQFVIDDQLYISDININSNLRFQSNSERIEITKGEIKVKQQTLNFDGKYIKALSEFSNVNITGKNNDIEILTSLIPKNFIPANYKNTIHGDISYECTIDGAFKSGNIPEVKILYEITDGFILDDKYGKLANNIYAKGNLSLGNGNNLNNSSLSINRFNVSTVNDKFLKGNININNLKSPKIDGKILLDLDLEYFNKFELLKDKDLISGNINGEINIKNLNVVNKKVITNDIDIEGDLNISDFQINKRNEDPEFKILSGKIKPSGQNIKFSETTIDYSGTIFKLDGDIINPLNSIFNNTFFDIKTNIETEKTDLNKLFQKSGNEGENNLLSDKLHLDADLKIKELTFDRFEAHNISTHLLYQDQQIKLNNLKFNSVNGLVNSDMIVTESNNGEINIKGKANLQEIDIHEFFYSFRNFGQTFIQAKHITGNLSGEIFFDTQWTQEFNIIDKDLLIESSIEVTNGELFDFSPMMELSDYLRVPDLKHISFSNLKNDVVIIDQKVNIPLMQINSSALNIEISGIHSFDQNISYDITLLLSEILSKRFKSSKSEDWIEYNDESSQAKIYLKAEGNVDDFDIKYDFQKTRDVNKIKRQEEKIELKAVLHQELGLFKKDSVELKKVIEKNDQKQKKKIQVIWDEEEETENEDPD